MTRRRRLILLVLVVAVAVPVLAIVGVGGYLRSGGLEREVADAWSSYGMPGTLTVGSVRLLGVGEAVAESVTLAEDGQPPLATARRVEVRFDLFDKRLLAVRIDGVRGALDQRRYRFLHAIIDAEHRHPPTRAPKPVRVEIVDAAVELPGGLLLSDAAVQVQALGPQAHVEGVGSLGGRPIRLTIDTDRAGTEAPIITTVEVVEAHAVPAALVAVAEGLGMIHHAPAELVAWLPSLADFAGTRIAIDPVSDSFRGPVTATWDGGQAACELDADARRINLRRLVLRDAKLGAFDGGLQAERSGAAIAVDGSPWQAGPGLPLPAGLPMADMAKLLPELHVSWPAADNRTSIAVTGPGRARLEVLVGGGTPPRLSATELPLVLAQGLLPSPLVLGGGHVVTASAVLAQGRPEFSAEVRQARLLAEGWSFGPLDGLVAVVVTPGGDVQVSAEMPKNAPTIAMSFTGNAAHGEVGIACEAVEGLLARLRGPQQLPDLTGRLELKTSFATAPGEVQVKVAKLALSDASLRLATREFVRGVSATLSGAARITPTTIDSDIGGHLVRGELRLPGHWLQLAALTPLFSLDVAAILNDGRLAELVLRRAMVRAATAAGEPTPGGYSAQIEGRLEGTRMSGSAIGIVDHADLAWLAALIVPGQVQVGGEGAVAFTASFDGGEVRRIDGSFLPLSADLDIDQGKLRVGGITGGGVRFTIGGDSKP